jgi:hypothetical protein
MGIDNFTSAMNHPNILYQQTPVISILSNGDMDLVWSLVDQVIAKKHFKID